MKKLYVTSVLMRESDTIINQVLGYRSALSSAEAKGLAIEVAQKKNPKSSLLNVDAMEIESQDMIAILKQTNEKTNERGK